MEITYLIWYSLGLISGSVLVLTASIIAANSKTKLPTIITQHTDNTSDTQNPLPNNVYHITPGVTHLTNEHEEALGKSLEDS